MKVLRPNFEKRGGLVVVITQDAQTREVLMQAYANEAAYLHTLQTGEACYYSTSRNELWVKGKTSGNTQHVWEVLIDCDGDTLIYLVTQEGAGAACHTGERSCFYRSVTGRYYSSKRRTEPIVFDIDQAFAEGLETVETKVRLEQTASN